MNCFDNFIDINLDFKNIIGCTDEFFCLYLNNVLKQEKKSILLVVNTLYEANSMYISLKNYSDNVYIFPMDDFLTSEALAISPDLKLDRLSTLNAIVNSSNPVIAVTNLMGYLRFLPNVNVYRNSILKLSVGDQITPSHLVEKFINLGYVRESMVSNTGDMASRGFVLDIFPIEDEYPIRFEFFGDEIVSIRNFDVSSQKSISELSSTIIKPCTEFICSSAKPSMSQKFLPSFTEVSCISDYLGDSILCYFKDYNQILNSYSKMLNDIEEFRSTKDVEFIGKYMFSFDDLPVDKKYMYFSINNIIDISGSLVKNFEVKPIDNFSENIDMIRNFINRNLHNEKTVVLCLKKPQLDSVVRQLGIRGVFVNDTFSLGRLNFVDADLSSGFIYRDFVFLTAAELFKHRVAKKTYFNKYRYSTSVKDITNIDIGDYVVHNVYGIGIYNGLKSLTSSGVIRDYVEVLYQGTDKIYIPVEKINLLSKYSGSEGKAPRISKLGGNDWKKTKSRVKKKVEDIAKELLNLYSEREKRIGFSFSTDSQMLRDFELEFPYELTVDQKKAIIQIKEDMESSKPMDRLLCGDVGFGKTEVAFVAAFKAILDSKQVVLLCPTTILSSQHYDNAIERFKNFPVNIALLNRFTTSSEKEKVLSGLANGTIDFVIGTHRLLSNDIIIKNLGLLIIDEEQRFGVSHKEKIKKYKTNVDVLTLSATPIPRTLQMSLTGIRSMSLIETPPVNRYPVQTYVIEENNQVITEAINKELARDGQVFILYNRIASIFDEYNRILSLVPNAKITIAHGQMTKEKLESCIMDFVAHKYDVLLCTTIIETGIDIPNVNTLIVKDADCFGLSQLYQLRGRVGRSNKFAYAYFMYNPKKILGSFAVKRLKAIKEFTELGSGFSIATRDLSIRGAGDILGSEQAGFIDSVGIDLFLKMLNDEMSSNGDDNNDNLISSKNNSINVSTHIDDSYVSDEDLKILIHQKISAIDSVEMLCNVKSELEDRFGRINDDIDIYMHEELFEKLIEKLDIKNVVQGKNSISMIVSNKILNKLDFSDILQMTVDITDMYRFAQKGENLMIVLDIIKLSKHPIYYLVDLLNRIDKELLKM